MRALLLVLVAAPAWADHAVHATEHVQMKLPDDAQRMAQPPIGAFSDAAEGWTLDRDDAVVLAQRSVLDGSCASFLAGERLEIAQVLKDDAGATMRQAVADAGKDALVSTGTQLVDGTWVASTMYTTCKGPEVVVISATSRHASSKPAIERMRALAVGAGASLVADGTPPATQRIGFGKGTIEVPAPAYPKRAAPPDMAMFSVPGMAALAITTDAFGGGCEAYLAQVLKNYTGEQQRAARAGAFEAVLVERTGDIVWRVARQLGSKGRHAHNWYTNLTATTCSGGLQGSLNAISFDGESPSRDLPAATVARLRGILAAAAHSLR